MTRKEIKQVLEANIINNIHDLNSYIKHSKDYRIAETLCKRDVLVNTIIIAEQLGIINYKDFLILSHTINLMCEDDIYSNDWRTYDI